MRRRALRLLGWGSALLAAGLTYAGWVSVTGKYIPCLFRSATGLLCPACGISHLCLALLAGNWAGAFAANPCLMLLSPLFLWLAVWLAADYVKTGRCLPSRGQNRLIAFLILCLVLFGIGRNLPWF